jgi:hypothetical protein
MDFAGDPKVKALLPLAAMLAFPDDGDGVDAALP